MPNPLLIAKSGDAELCLLPALANRHGLITGATGTGKTITLQVLAELGTPQVQMPMPQAQLLRGQRPASAPDFLPRRELERLQLGRLQAVVARAAQDRVEVAA